jgi:hypothetical protein
MMQEPFLVNADVEMILVAVSQKNKELFDFVGESYGLVKN